MVAEVEKNRPKRMPEGGRRSDDGGGDGGGGRRRPRHGKGRRGGGGRRGRGKEGLHEEEEKGEGGNEVSCLLDFLFPVIKGASVLSIF